MKLMTPIVKFVVHQAIGEIGDKAVQWIEDRYADPTQALPTAIAQANAQTWNLVEFALPDPSFFVTWAKEKTLSGTERGVLTPLKNWIQSQDKGFRAECLAELRAARSAGLLEAVETVKELITADKTFARISDPCVMLEKARGLLAETSKELNGYPNLVRFLSDPEGKISTWLTSAFSYFLRQSIVSQPKLREDLQFEMLSQVWQNWEGFKQLLAVHGETLSMQLGRQEAEMADIKAMLLRLLKCIPEHARRGSIPSSFSASLGSVNDTKLLDELEKRIGSMHEGKYNRELLGGLGRLAMGIGVYDHAADWFQQEAALPGSDIAKAEAYYNEYQAYLEQQKWEQGLTALRVAVRLDEKRFSPFPFNKYEPRKILGAGGFGVAFQCQHVHLEHLVVVKTFHLETLDRDIADVFQEGRILQGLRHPSIVAVNDCDYAGENKQRPYLVMEYFPAESLKNYLSKNGCLTLDQTIFLAKRIAEAMKSAHDKGVFHRDLKPDNLLINLKEGNPEVKIIDFGLAVRSRVIQESIVAGTINKSILALSLGGTYEYSAPEQIGSRNDKVGPWSDIYAFGKTLNQALFLNPQPSRKKKSLTLENHPFSNSFSDFLEDCIESAPEDRPQNFGEVLDRLAKVTYLGQGKTYEYNDVPNQLAKYSTESVTRSDSVLRGGTSEIQVSERQRSKGDFSQFGKNKDDDMTGSEILAEYKRGERFFVGRNLGLHGKILRNDVATGKWKTHMYEVNKKSKILPATRNWFTVEDFIKKISGEI